MPWLWGRVYPYAPLAGVLYDSLPNVMVEARAQQAAKHRAGLRERLATYLGSVSLLGTALLVSVTRCIWWTHRCDLAD